ncbi:hypothetical protein AB0465_37790 [Streptomyces griseoviridis]
MIPYPTNRWAMFYETISKIFFRRDRQTFRATVRPRRHNRS